METGVIISLGLYFAAMLGIGLWAWKRSTDDISGYLLGGGFGWNSGAWGIACFSVEAVEVGNGRARGVRLRDGSLVRASAVVVATGPRDAAKLVDGGEHPAMHRTVDGLTPVRIACLDMALERLPERVHGGRAAE
jgi:hypothetical protein